VAIRRVATAEARVGNGSIPSVVYRATVVSSATAAPIAVPSPNISRCRAVPPKVVSQAKTNRLGRSSTPAMNSRMVLPRDMRAMKMPTNGDQAIHQAQ